MWVKLDKTLKNEPSRDLLLILFNYSQLEKRGPGNIFPHRVQQKRRRYLSSLYLRQIAGNRNKYLQLDFWLRCCVRWPWILAQINKSMQTHRKDSNINEKNKKA